MRVRIVFPILPSSVAVEMLDLKIDVHKTVFKRAGFEITAEKRYNAIKKTIQLLKQKLQVIQ